MDVICPCPNDGFGHTVRTFLLAKATAAIFGCRRSSRLVNHPWVLSILFFAARMAERPRGSAMCASTRSRAYSFRAEMSGSFNQMDHPSLRGSSNDEE